MWPPCLGATRRTITGRPKRPHDSAFQVFLWLVEPFLIHYAVVKLLLINPKMPQSFWSFSWIFAKIIRHIKATTPPLGLATIAALTPPNWEITIIDENIESIDGDFEADIVGVCGMNGQFFRQKGILSHFRRRGSYVVAGGSFASLCPEEYIDLADTVICGEAEYIWPKFCTDFEAGTPKKLYRETGEVDLKDSPPPRYDLLKLHLYLYASLQFSRGCPFRCEFCDIIVMFGRKPRTKSLDQIERELDLLRSQGLRNVTFVDDNLIGHLPQCKKLLAFLAAYQEKNGYRFIFATEASINMAADHELMRLFRAANFAWIFIGIESPSKEALLETKKEQNTRNDLLDSVRTIYSYGIDVMAGFIIGFDADDQKIFERQYRFILDSGIIVPMVGLMFALQHTPLYERLQNVNRLRPISQYGGYWSGITNVIPLNMTYDEMVEGYRQLWMQLVQEKAIYRRIRNKLRYLTKPLPSRDLPRTELLFSILQFLLHGLFKGGYKRWYYFTRSLLLALKDPKRLSCIMADWTAAISIRTFALQYIVENPTKRRWFMPHWRSRTSGERITSTILCK